MRFPFQFLLIGLLILGMTRASASADEQLGDAKIVRTFLAKYCQSCHGKKLQKGERRFDSWRDNIDRDSTLVDYQDVLDQLNLSSMPPEEAKQPADKERQQAIAILTKRIKRYHESVRVREQKLILRRLNSREYRNSIRDLFRLDMRMFDPAAAFPRDQTVEHRDNDGEALVTSGYLLRQYLAAADRIVDKAVFPLQRPAEQKWRFEDGFRQQPEIDQVHRRTSKFKHMILYDVVGADKHEGAYGPILAFKEGVPQDGHYEIRLKAEALNRKNPYDPAFLGTDPSEPLRLGIVAGNYRVGALHKPQPIEPLLAELDLADSAKWYTVKVYLDAGYTPRFTFRNGLMDARNLWSRLLRKYKDQFPPRKRPGIVEARFNAIKYGKLPQIHIHEIEIRGPLYESWPTKSQQAALGKLCEPFLSGDDVDLGEIRKELARFGERAYRRPLEPEELDRLTQLYSRRKSEGQTPVRAYADVLKAVLCSPHFLYVNAPSRDQKSKRSVRPLSDIELASRLSYFLWSSMPDSRLRSLARERKLHDSSVLAKEIERMLSDPKSDAFVEGFLGSWLTLRDLGATPPDRTQFRSFYHYDLDHAMREETRLFTRHLLDENLSVGNFIDSDFTFVNKALARHYKIPPPKSTGFHRVELKDRRRGGLLGQASVLTVSANGIDTSPVVRGVWLLENFLGTPPSPPPPDVEPIDPDVRGAKTIRDQLTKHRSTPSCYDCHRKIDPLGFALENYDAIGGWRTTYRGRRPIDTSGKLPGGGEFHDIVELKDLLKSKQTLFARALSGKLLAYGMGRHLEPRDRPVVDKLVNQVESDAIGFRDLIKQVILSDAFRSQ